MRNADAKSSARLLAAQDKESGSWLTAPPISSVGLRLDNEVVRVAVGLHLGSPLCIEHHCQHCGQIVDTSGTHGLSCCRSKGLIPRHSALNDLVQRSLNLIQVPSRLEPLGLFRSDGQRPNGITVNPWSRGKALVWDITCHDSFAPSNLPFSSIKAGSVADRAATSKCRLYEDLSQSHCLFPFPLNPLVFLVVMLQCFFVIWPIVPDLKLVIHKPISILPLKIYICICIMCVPMCNSNSEFIL